MKKTIVTAVAMLAFGLAVVPIGQASIDRPTHHKTAKASRVLSDAHVGTAKAELVAQRDHSEDVIAFFTKSRSHRWLVAPRHETCWSVAWAKTCNRARNEVKAHRWLHDLAVERLRKLYPETYIPTSGDVGAIIDAVFGPYAGEAKTVASCESGWRTWAVNGQYLGIFQMGDHERATYASLGYASAYAQVVAAHNYFVAAHGWGPWECKP